MTENLTQREEYLLARYERANETLQSRNIELQQARHLLDTMARALALAANGTCPDPGWCRELIENHKAIKESTK